MNEKTLFGPHFHAVAEKLRKHGRAKGEIGMTEQVINFLESRGIKADAALSPILLATVGPLEEAENTVSQLVATHHDRLSSDPAWTVMHDMYKRCYEYCSGTVACLLTGHIASAEALCRTTIEGSVNLVYVSLGDSTAHVISYLKDHLSNERKQNRQWYTSVAQSDYPKGAKDHHFSCITKKNEALDFYEKMLQISLTKAGVDFDSYVEAWPSIFERFKTIRKEVSYRTVYVALCSQAHNDAEEILNSIMARVTDVPGVAEGVNSERFSFAFYMVLTAIQYYIEAAAMFLGKYEIEGANHLLVLHSDVGKYIGAIATDAMDWIARSSRNE